MKVGARVLMMGIWGSRAVQNRRVHEVNMAKLMAMGKTYFSKTRTLAPLAAICVAVVKPPMPPPTMTASYNVVSSGWSRALCLCARCTGASATRA